MLLVDHARDECLARVVCQDTSVRCNGSLARRLLSHGDEGFYSFDNSSLGNNPESLQASSHHPNEEESVN